MAEQQPVPIYPQITEDELSKKPLSRRAFRSLVFHFLYAMESHQYQEPLSTIIDDFNINFDLTVAHDGDIAVMAQGIIDEREKLDKMIEGRLANWRLERLGCVTLLILRMGLWEILHTKTPINIVINEAVELAKDFAETDAYKFINGILDKLVQAVRLQSTEGE